MFGDSGRRAATEDEVLCAPAVATDPAVAMVAVLRKFLRSMKTSIQEILIRTDASETAEIAKVIQRTRCRPLPIRSLENHFNEFLVSENCLHHAAVYPQRSAVGGRRKLAGHVG